MPSPYEIELIIMSTLGCSLAQAHAEYASIEPILINLQHPVPVGRGTVTAAALNVRETPTVKAKLCGELPAGFRVAIWGRRQTKTEGLWLCVPVGEVAGWVSAAWVQEEP